MPTLLHNVTSLLDVDRDSRSADVDRVGVALEVAIGESRNRRASVLAMADDLTCDVACDGELDVVLGGVDDDQSDRGVVAGLSRHDSSSETNSYSSIITDL